MSAHKSQSRAVRALTYSERVTRYEDQHRLSDTHHKILDYRVAEILLSTLVLGIIAFFRLHY